MVVIEPDASYSDATTPQGAGGIRQQFSVAENIAMSRYSLDFYRHFAANLGDVPDLPDINFRREGYLLLVGRDGRQTLQRNQQRQTTMGVNAELIDYREIRNRFPSIRRNDIVLGCHTPDDGWIDPTAGLWGFRRAAQHLGVSYVSARVCDLRCDKGAVRAAVLDSGEQLNADFFINTAGPWAADIAAMTGSRLPVLPLCRVQHYWQCADALEALPLVKDESGLFFRPEGDGFVGGCPSFAIAPGFVDDIYSGFFAHYFEDTVWPMLAALVPNFENSRLQRSWAGHYAQNTLDGNMIIGRYAAAYDNIITACGFSGHGIMHAPAVGRALAELALTGSWQTLDLSRLQFARIEQNRLLPEAGIK